MADVFRWHNVPVDQAAKRTNGVPTATPPTAVPKSDNIDLAEPDSQPLNFDTFVPTHDPSLHHDVDPLNHSLGTPAGSMASQDEAFSRAMTAMYWGGYWTAMYHVGISLFLRRVSDSSTSSVSAQSIKPDRATRSRRTGRNRRRRLIMFCFLMAIPARSNQQLELVPPLREAICGGQMILETCVQKLVRRRTNSVINKMGTLHSQRERLCSCRRRNPLTDPRN
jgi:hypothetical protein